MKNFYPYLIIFLVFFSCDKTKLEDCIDENQTLQKQLEICKEILPISITPETVPGVIESYDFKDDTIYFNLDPSFPDTQIIHLSSGKNKLQFMVLCQIHAHEIMVKKEPKMVLDSIQLAIRSLENSPKIALAIDYSVNNTPKLIPFTDDGFSYKLEGKMMLRTKETRINNSERVAISSAIKYLSYGELIEVHIDPSPLLAQLESESFTESPFIEHLKDNLHILCCDGRICSLRVVYGGGS